MSHRYQKAADELGRRLLIFHELQVKCRERGDDGEWIDARDMWAPADQAALDEFTEARAELFGLQPLFPESKEQSA